MNKAHDLIKREIIKTEKAIFLGRLIFILAGYIGTTLWLNRIRQSAALWFVWFLVIIQLLFFFSIFVTCSMRAIQCGYRYSFWTFFLLAVLSKVNDWEFFIIPIMVITMLVLSWLNQKVSPEKQYLLSEDGDIKIKTDNERELLTKDNLEK